MKLAIPLFLSVVGCSFEQMASDAQQKMQVNSLQLLYYQAPLSATVLMPVIVIFEPLFADRGIFAVWFYEALVSCS